jgi:hypothetical protein
MYKKLIKIKYKLVWELSKQKNKENKNQNDKIKFFFM